MRTVLFRTGWLAASGLYFAVCILVSVRWHLWPRHLIKAQWL